MSNVRERSAVFKFFYVILSVITFPIFAVMFVLRHPVWFLFVLLVLGCGAVYFPMSKGVAFDQIGSWYLAQYQAVKVQTVSKALDSGVADLVPESLSSDVERMKQQYKEEAAEAQLPKGENYNKKVVRDKKIEVAKAGLKKRGGFKKKVSSSEAVLSAESQEDATAVLLEESGVKAGGLAGILKKENKAPEVKTEDMPAVVETKPEVVEEKNEVQAVVPETQTLDDKAKEENKEEKSFEDESEFDLF